jgi:hypothetical protein
MSAPPVFTPPDVPPFLLPPEEVIVTQPTPEIEHHKGESRRQTNRYAARPHV